MRSFLIKLAEMLYIALFPAAFVLTFMAMDIWQPDVSFLSSKSTTTGGGSAAFELDGGGVAHLTLILTLGTATSR